jgi:hypothetical protein
LGSFALLLDNAAATAFALAENINKNFLRNWETGQIKDGFGFLLWYHHSQSKYDALEARQASKLQNRRPLFDVELYLTVHKSFISTSVNIIHRGCTFHLSYPYWTAT